MPWFSSGRDEGFPSHYGEQHTAAHVDVLTSGLIMSFVILLFAFMLILPAYTSKKRFLTTLAYTVLSLFVGGIVLVGNYGSEWEVGKIKMTSPYKPAAPEEMRGELGLHVSLRGVNITLKGDIKTPNLKTLAHEIIDYNENFSWEWAQGRFGFGPYAGRVSREFRSAVIRGSPTPILVLAEYFTFDGEGLRFGRHYRLAGYYAHFFMWIAFATWILSNILFFMVIRMGAILLTMTGLLQIIAIIIWSCVRNSIEISVPFESIDGSHEVFLQTSYGPDYYLVLLNGIICVIGGIALIVLDDFFKEQLCEIFGIDPLSVYFYEYQTKAESDAELRHTTDIPRTSIPGHPGTFPIINSMEMGTIDEDEFENEQRSAVHLRPNAQTAEPVIVRKRRTNAKSLYGAVTRKSKIPAFTSTAPIMPELPSGATRVMYLQDEKEKGANRDSSTFT